MIEGLTLLFLEQISVPDADKTDTWFNRMTISKLVKEAPGVRKHVPGSIENRLITARARASYACNGFAFAFLHLLSYCMGEGSRHIECFLPMIVFSKIDYQAQSQ